MRLESSGVLWRDLKSLQRQGVPYAAGTSVFRSLSRRVKAASRVMILPAQEIGVEVFAQPNCEVLATLGVEALPITQRLEISERV